MSKRCYIFDLDGTLCDDSHRAHHVTVRSDWDAYYAACPDDKPIQPVMSLLQALYHCGFDIVLVTGRPEAIRPETEAWLIAHGVFWSALFMRKNGDRRRNSAIKQEIIAKLRADGYEVMMAFEDLSSAVKAYRAVGVPCAQVAEAKEWGLTHGGSH